MLEITLEGWRIAPGQPGCASTGQPLEMLPLGPALRSGGSLLKAGAVARC